MTLRQSYRFVAVIMALLFLSFQFGGAAHDIRADEQTHHAECVVCHVLTDQSDNIVIPVTTIAPISWAPVAMVGEYTNSVSVIWGTTPPGRAPPPRGPPLTHT